MPESAPSESDLNINLGLAMVVSSHGPVLLLDEDRVVVAASESFCEAFGIDAAAANGRDLASLGGGEWSVPQLQSLLKATAAGFADVRNYEFDLKREGRSDRHLLLNAHKLNYGGGAIRVLLSIADMTDARTAEKANDDLLRDKTVLLQELQHRVANSLQIIASVLLQSARRVQSEEVRGHLRDAHSRVMSIAAIQKQLSVSSSEDVSLQPYFNQLCDSIGASMIHDSDRIKLEVRSDDHRVDAALSVSLGLVVTELVINALKHAFPKQRPGKILVDYSCSGTDWTLSVSDNGVGISRKPDANQAGLGTSIVRALAHRLDADLTISDAKPGTRVSLVHPIPGGAAPSVFGAPA